ncbi:ATP-dependent RNA helicase DeaD [Nitrobacteraceae bacterium AZCC 1564]
MMRRTSDSGHSCPRALDPFPLLLGNIAIQGPPSVNSISASPPLARALTERNYNDPTPVQKAVLAEEAADRDLLVSAQTGSGKTVAYGLAIARDLLGDAERLPKATAPLALIVAPTRELALQVHRELTWLYQHAGARVVSCVGGMDPRQEMRELADGVHIVVGTPGRLCDHIRRKRLDISELKAIVLDEADEMLDLGFREDMEFILEATPETRRTLLFSATLPRGIAALAEQYQQDAFRIEVAGTEGGHADIEYRAIRVAPSDVEHAVVNTLRFYESPTAIVFCNTRGAVNHLQAALLERGFSVVALSGEMTQNERTKALQSLRDSRSRICVATDVAARGIDLPNLGLVIHADLPNDPEVLQHRSGRTGRAGKKGVSVLLVPPARRRRADLLLNMADIDVIWGVAPTAEEIRALDQQRMLQGALFSDQANDEDIVFARALLAERSTEEIATALARLYRSQLPAPEDILDPGENRRSSDDRRSKDKRDTSGSGQARKGKSRGLPEGGVWFRAAIGRRKNAEARWLLPMICRRGNISKQDIGTIRIFDTTTEFEVSVHAADEFALQIKRPDKEDNIRIEALPDGPQRESISTERSLRKPMHGGNSNEPHHKDRRHSEEKPRGKEPHQFKSPPPRGKKPKRSKAADNPAWPTVEKPAFGKKKKKRRH